MAQENPESLADEFKITRHYIIFDGKAHDYDALLASDGRTKASTRRNISPAAWVHLRGPISSAVRIGVTLYTGYAPVMDPNSEENIGCILILPAQTERSTQSPKPKPGAVVSVTTC